jgi:hypothetical protein
MTAHHVEVLCPSDNKRITESDARDNLSNSKFIHVRWE